MMHIDFIFDGGDTGYQNIKNCLHLIGFFFQQPCHMYKGEKTLPARNTFSTYTVAFTSTYSSHCLQ